MFNWGHWSRAPSIVVDVRQEQGRRLFYQTLVRIDFPFMSHKTGTSAPVVRVTKILPKPKPVIPKPQLHIPERYPTPEPHNSLHLFPLDDGNSGGCLLSSRS